MQRFRPAGQRALTSPADPEGPIAAIGFPPKLIAHLRHGLAIRVHVVEEEEHPHSSYEEQDFHVPSHFGH